MSPVQDGRAESSEQSPYGQRSIAPSKSLCLPNNECPKYSFEATRYQIAGLENIDLKIVPPPEVRPVAGKTIEAVVIDTEAEKMVRDLASTTFVSGLLQTIQTASQLDDFTDDVIEAVSQPTHRAHMEFSHLLKHVPYYEARQAVMSAISKKLREEKRGHCCLIPRKPGWGWHARYEQHAFAYTFNL
ncbi:hypothetical protein LTR70_007823 [Exophiala xenobiotica]|uniref:Vitellogenin n=1 Tax=Lithohypha guttulata TaxID=1690604 RepID=A0ABR0K3D3_9EURO|nr:hypothetical protein LTR24_007434 [Lithohypha guttulata]KAK5313068.1 hypothetical protein LTR70_007823 [Exophiala xenobiotica]